MDRYIKNGEIKPRNRIVIRKDGMQTINPPHEMLIEDGWQLYVIPEPTPEELLEKAKRLRRREILEYDSSEDVNVFYLNDEPIWLDKATRAGLKLRFEAETALGNTDTSLWYNGKQYHLPLSQAMQMLYALEVYASQCYDNTQRLLAQLDTFTTIEQVEAFEDLVGYPEKLYL